MADDPLVPFDVGKPNVARGYNYALGGKDHFEADREQHEEFMKVFPLGAVLVRENREFLARAVSYVAGQGITQFIDVGAGLPSSPDVHEIAGLACADARVAYVDNDPMVITHIAALLARPGRVAAVPGDVRCPEDILANAELASVIDTGRPFCVILGLILDHVEPAQAAEAMATFREAMPAGSFLVLSIGVNDNAPDVARDVIKVYHAMQVYLHGRDEVRGYLAGLEIVEPGLTEARRWRPAQAPVAEDSRPGDILVGVARKLPAAS